VVPAKALESQKSVERSQPVTGGLTLEIVLMAVLRLSYRSLKRWNDWNAKR
jgi:hypothetical protein